MPKNNFYFDEKTELKVKEFLQTKDKIKRNYIFENHLYSPLRKIAEYMVNKGHYYPELKIDSEQLINDIISYLYSKIEDYNENKGSAFTFFTMTAQFYVMSLISKQKKGNPISIQYFQMNTFYDKNHYELEDYYKRQKLFNYYNNLIKFLEENKAILFENYEIALFDFFILIFKQSSEFIDNIGKRKFYLLVNKEYPNITQKQTYQFLNKLLNFIKLIKTFYDENGYIDNNELLKIILNNNN